MQLTKGIWHLRKQCAPGSLSSHAREPGNEDRGMSSNVSVKYQITAHRVCMVFC